jgi:mannitol-specific phosphotransferase system IIBC component
MYNNLGSRLKTLAIVIAIVGIVGSVVTGIILATAGGFLAFLIPAVAGSLVSWLGSWVMYAIGETHERTEQNAAALSEIRSKLTEVSKTEVSKTEVSKTEVSKSSGKKIRCKSCDGEYWGDNSTCPYCGYKP